MSDRKFVLVGVEDRAPQAAIRALNEARACYFLMKRWDPPEENLFPALDHLLSDWADFYGSEYGAQQVVYRQRARMSTARMRDLEATVCRLPA